MGDTLKNWNNQKASHAWLKKSYIHLETKGFIFAIQDRVINTRNDKKTHVRLNTFLLAPFWLKANIRNVMIYSLKLYT
jgi:hypothetical protein